MNTKKDIKLLCSIYVHHFHLERLKKLGLQEGNGNCDSEQYLHINLDDIPECFSALKKQIQTNPVRAKAIVESGVVAVQNFLIKRHPNYTKCSVRVYFSASSDQSPSPLSQCRAEGHMASLVGKLVVVQARVIRMINPKLIQKRSEYKCRECGHVFFQENKHCCDIKYCNNKSAQVIQLGRIHFRKGLKFQIVYCHILAA